MRARQSLEVPGDVGLRASGQGGELGHVLLASEQHLDQPQPHRLGEHRETVRDQLQGLVGKDEFGHTGEKTAA